MQKLEQIENFGAFLDFLSNPKEYEQLVKDVRKAAKDYKELVEKQRGIKDIDAWRASESVKISKRYDELDRLDAAHIKNVSDLSGKVSDHKKSVSAANKKLQEKTEELNGREEAVQGLEKQKAKLDKVAAEYVAKMANLKADKEQLKADIARIKAATGSIS